MQKQKTKNKKQIRVKRGKRIVKKQEHYPEIRLRITFLMVILVTSFLTFYLPPLKTSLSFFNNSPFRNSFPEVESRPQDVIGKIRMNAVIQCAKYELGEDCVLDLLGMAYTETRFNCEAVGDGGMSFGCFQIHRGYHKHITVEQARNIEFAVKWTMDRLIHYGYKTDRDVAVMRHNGTPYIPKTIDYLSKVNKYIRS